MRTADAACASRRDPGNQHRETFHIIERPRDGRAARVSANAGCHRSLVRGRASRHVNSRNRDGAIASRDADRLWRVPRGFGGRVRHRARPSDRRRFGVACDRASAGTSLARRAFPRRCAALRSFSRSSISAARRRASTRSATAATNPRRIACCRSIRRSSPDESRRPCR